MRLRVVGAVVVLLCGGRAAAVPFHGCTFFSGRMMDESMKCADLSVEPFGCTIPACVGAFGVDVCVPIPGVKVSGWFPEYFIEVANRAGSSIFAKSVDSPHLKLQLAVAQESWKNHGVIPDEAKYVASGEAPRDGHEFSMYFGRSLKVPYMLPWFIASTGKTAGTMAIPECYTGITELAPDTWADSMLSSGDRLISSLWAPVTGPVCGIAGAAMSYLPSIPGFSGELPPAPTPQCALPLPSALQQTLALAGSTARAPGKQCMGQLGPVLPRTGWTNGESWTAGQRVAWRTASMTEEYFRAGLGVRDDDKWQVVHPNMVAPRCFKPGSLTRPSTIGITDPNSVLVRGPGYDSPDGNGEAEYVFAVWRRFEMCSEITRAAAIEPELLTFEIRGYAACLAANQIGDWVPSL